MTRIIAGTWRGHTLPPILSGSARPTTDRARTKLFDTLWDVSDCKVLDLFSGSGGLGLEAMSRGASELVSIDKDRDYIQAQKAWAEYRGAPFKGIVADVYTALSQFADSRFDLIFADPPYETVLETSFIDQVARLLSPSGRFVYERAKSDSAPLKSHEIFLTKEKLVAETRIQIYTKGDV